MLTKNSSFIELFKIFENYMKTIKHRTNGNIIAVYFGNDPTLKELRSPAFLSGDLRNVPITPEFEGMCEKDTKDILQRHGQKDSIDLLLYRLSQGTLDGTANLSDRACFIGTLMAMRREDHEQFTKRTGLNPGLNLPSVQWFFQIGIGDTPKNNCFAYKAECWCLSVLRCIGKRS